MMKSKKMESAQAKALLELLEKRFLKNMSRHKAVAWADVLLRLQSNPDALWSLHEMERTGGEPDVVQLASETGSLFFVDCSAESPTGRRSLCYDKAGLDSRKEHKPLHAAIELAAEIGLELMDESQYRQLQQLGAFATQYKLSLFAALFSHSLPSAVSGRAIAALHEFGRQVNDLEYRARHTVGHDAARAFLTEWLKDIAYEKHLYDSEDNEKVAAARWTNVMDFCDWVAGRCGGQIEDEAGATTEAERKSLLEVVQTIALLSTLSEREQDQNVVTLSTLHASKGLEWPHVMLVGVNEGLLPFKTDQADSDLPAEALAQRLQEERRLMYVGITRAQRTLAVSWLKRRKKGRESVPGSPSRFIAEMALDQATTREDPREKLKALRAEFAQRAREQADRQNDPSAR